jgi:hypothetical protein
LRHGEFDAETWREQTQTLDIEDLELAPARA